jgi:hypothetical protein
MRWIKPKPEIVLLDVGGVEYKVSIDTLKRSDCYCLLNLVRTYRSDVDGPIHIDRNGRLFGYVLDYLRTGKLLLPSNVSEKDVEEELDYCYFGNGNDDSPKSPIYWYGEEAIEMYSSYEEKPKYGLEYLKELEERVLVLEHSLAQWKERVRSVEATMRHDFSSEKPKTTVRLDVGGVLYKASYHTVMHCEVSLLASLVSEHLKGEDSDKPIFIDRNGRLFEYVLHYLETSDLNVPSWVSRKAVQEELKFYDIDKDMMMTTGKVMITGTCGLKYLRELNNNVGKLEKNLDLWKMKARAVEAAIYVDLESSRVDLPARIRITDAYLPSDMETLRSCLQLNGLVVTFPCYAHVTVDEKMVDESDWQLKPRVRANETETVKDKLMLIL